jgi:hypothetical protein
VSPIGPLTRSEMRAFYDELRREAQGQCARYQAGLVTLKGVVRPDGTPSGIRVSGGLAGTPAGDCVLALARRMKVRPIPAETPIDWPPFELKTPTPANQETRPLPEDP